MKRSLLSVTALLALAACNTTTSDGIYAEDPIGRLAGTVTDMDGKALEGVEITAGDLVAVSGPDGAYLIDGVTPGDDLVLQFRLDGYAKGYQRASLHSWETVGVDATLTEIDGFGVFDSSLGGLIEVGDVRVDFAADTIVDELGQPYDGDVRVEVTYLDPSTDDMKFAPGDLTALAFNRSNPDAKDVGEPAQLVSYGMADISLYADGSGEALNIAEGSSAGVDFVVQNNDLDGNPLPATYAISAGDEQQTWSFDTDRGVWVEEGVGGVYAETETVYEERDVYEEQDIIDDDPESETYGEVIGTEQVWVGTEQVAVGQQETGRLRFSFEATHFSWWNCDQGFVPSCATGRVVDMMGFPVRSAQLNARGSQSNATVYTDEEGYYVVSIMVGDSVTFTGSTVVGGRSWSATQSKFMDGEGSSAATCEPIPTIEIEVCREAGIVMADHLEMHVSGMDVGQNGDQLRAWFWEPNGEPANCSNPWDELAVDECYVAAPEQYPSHFAPREVGLASTTRSVGGWMELRTSRDTYHIDEGDIDGNPVYVYDTIEVQGQSTELTTNEIDLRSGDVIRGQAPGSSNDYFGPIQNETWMTVPTDVNLSNIRGPQSSVSRTGGLTIEYNGANNSDDMVVMVTSDPTADGLLCKYADDGSIKLGADDLGSLTPGYTSVSVYRPDFSWTTGPDGLPIRLQSFSGAVIEANLR